MQVDISKIRSIESLARFLAVKESFFEEFPKKKEEYITLTVVPKRDGGTRIVYEAKGILEQAHKVFQLRASDLFLIHKAAHGYTKGKSAHTNAAHHAGKRTIVKIDIHNFFNSISEKSITEFLMKSGFQKEIAPILSSLFCTKESLEAGFCISPIIANAMCYELDIRIQAWADENNIIYSRYSDDMTFSFEKRLSEKTEDIPTEILPVEKIILAFGFNLNRDKTKCMFRGEPQYVTGFPVTKAGVPLAPKSLKIELKTALYYIKKYGIKEHIHREYLNTMLGEHPDKESIIKSGTFVPKKEKIDRLFGLIGYIRGVESIFIQKLRDKDYLPETSDRKSFVDFCHAADTRS